MSEPKHCEHECVCGRLCATRARQDGKPCEPGYSHWEGCNYDTRSRPTPAPVLTEHDMTYAYEHGSRDGAAKEREQVLKIIDSGISALDEITVDGYVPLGERGKRDVLVWLREKVQKEPLREGAK